jgi:hypothetical protein
MDAHAAMSQMQFFARMRQSVKFFCTAAWNPGETKAEACNPPLIYRYTVPAICSVSAQRERFGPAVPQTEGAIGPFVVFPTLRCASIKGQ